MSAVKVWVAGAWQDVDLTGPQGDRGATGANGSSSLVTNGITLVSNRLNMADGLIGPNNPTPSGPQGVQPCMTAPGGNELAAVKAGVYVVSIMIQMTANATTDASNWVIINRSVADAQGQSRLVNGDIARGSFLSTCNVMAWLGIGERINFQFNKSTGNNCDVLFTIRAAMLQ